eukprot:TRINITY_DN12969_c0_g2_i1.p1 TRINITY_DN12969_c0_g2~~TRINITY_DN12969_c0_g2_i1.p1  ORF type:complete len:1307 (+),score=219.03 TRINITY_DN12969_c0_g2_i1:79-3999(+)
MAESSTDDDTSESHEESAAAVSDSDRNDDVCMKCGQGGELLCCEGCCNAAHVACAGLEAVPEDDWFCDFCLTARLREGSAEDDRADLPSRPCKVPRCEAPRTGPPDKCPKVLIEDGPAAGWQVEVFISRDITDTRGWAPRPIFISPAGESTRAPKAFRQDASIPLGIRQQVDKLWQKLRLQVQESSSAAIYIDFRSSQRPTIETNIVKSRQARCICRAPDPFLEVCRQRFATAVTDRSFSLFSTKRLQVRQAARSVARVTHHSSGELDSATVLLRPVPSPARSSVSTVALSSSISQIMAGIFERDDNAMSSAMASYADNLDMAWAKMFAGSSDQQTAHELVDRTLREGSDQRKVFQRLLAVACSPHTKADSMLATVVAIVSSGELLRADSAGFSSGNAMLGQLAAHGLSPSFAQQVILSKAHRHASPLALTAALGILLGTLASESASAVDVARDLEKLLHESEVVELDEISWPVWSHGAALLLGLLWSKHGRSSAERLHQVHAHGPARFGLQLRHFQELVSLAAEAAEEHERQLQSLQRSQDGETCKQEQGPRETYSEIQSYASSQLPQKLRNELAERLLASRKPVGLGQGGFLHVAERLLSAEGIAACSKSHPLGTMGELVLETVGASSPHTRSHAAKQICQSLSAKPWAQPMEESKLSEEELLQAFGMLSEQEHPDAWCAVVAWASLDVVSTQLPFLCATLMDFLCKQSTPSPTARAHTLRELFARLLLVQRALRCSTTNLCRNRQQQELELLRCIFKKLFVLGTEDTRYSMSSSATFRGLGSFTNTGFALTTSAEYFLQQKSPMQGCLLVAWVQLLQVPHDATVELAGFLESLMSRAAHRCWARWQQGLMILTGLCPGNDACALPDVPHPSDTPMAAKFVAGLWHRTSAFSLKLVMPPCSETHMKPQEFEMARDEELRVLLGSMLEAWSALMAACTGRPCTDALQLIDGSQTDLVHCLIRRLLPQVSGTRMHKLLCVLLTIWRDELKILCRVELPGSNQHDQPAWQKRLAKAEATSAAVVPVLASGDLRLQHLCAEIIALSLVLCARHENRAAGMKQFAKQHFCRTLFSKTPLPELNVSSQGETFCFSDSSKLARFNGKTFAQVYVEDQQFVHWSLNNAVRSSPTASAGHQLVNRFAKWVLCNVLEPEPVWLAVWNRPAVPLSQSVAASRAAVHFFMTTLSAISGAEAKRWLEAEAIDSALRLGCLLLAQGLPESPVWQDVCSVLELGQGVRERKPDGTWRHAMTGLLRLLIKHEYGGCGSHAVLARFIRDTEALLPLARGDAAVRHLQTLQKITKKRAAAAN